MTIPMDPGTSRCLEGRPLVTNGSPGPNRLANLLLVVAGVVLPLAVLEIGLRASGAIPPGIYQADTSRLYRLVPNGRKTFTHRKGNGGEQIDVRINADGFRGPPLRPVEGSGRRIMVYGDSFIAGEVSPDSLTFVRGLERLLQERHGSGVEVINAGVVAYGPDQEFVAILEDLPRMRPSAVVLAVFADNDMGDLVRDKLFRLSADSQLIRVRPVLATGLGPFLEEQAHPSGWRRSHLLRWIERRLGGANSASLEDPRGKDRSIGSLSPANYMEWALGRNARQFADLRERGDTVTTLLGDNYDADIAINPEGESARYKEALMGRLLEAVQAAMDSVRLPFVLVVIPSPIDICENYDIRVDSTRYPAYDRRRLTRVVDSLAARWKIKTVDLYQAFATAGACSLYFRNGDLHWNPTGQRLAATILADSLASWGIPE